MAASAVPPPRPGAAPQAPAGRRSLRPWDLAVDPAGPPAAPPLQTSMNGSWTAAAASSGRSIPTSRSQFDYIRDEGLLDLDSRKGKAPGGYQTASTSSASRSSSRTPRGSTATSRRSSTRAATLPLARSARPRAALRIRDYPTEFAEVASMGMELLGQPHLEEFYRRSGGRPRPSHHLEGLLSTLPVGRDDRRLPALGLHRPRTTREVAGRAWLEPAPASGRRGGLDGLRGAEAYNWHRQLHLFTVPFYYIEYGIAQTGALQVWRQGDGRRGRHSGYREALAMGGSRPLPDLFAAAGAKFDFTADTLRPLMDEIATGLDVPRAGI